MPRPFIILGILISLGFASFEPATAEEPFILDGDQHREAEFNKSGSHTLTLELDAGEYVQGEVSGKQVTLSLIDAKGGHVRRLASGSGQQAFMFVVGDQGPYRLQLATSESSAAIVKLTNVVPPENQFPPPIRIESPSLRELQHDLQRGEGTDAFWKKVASQGTPLIESQGVEPPLASGELLVTFLWRGARNNVRLFGAPSNDHDPMIRLEDTDVWYRSYRVADTARITYRIAPDVPELNASAWVRRRAILATAQRDPLNHKYLPETAVDMFAGESLVELPNAPKQPWLTPDPQAVSGQVEPHEFASSLLNNRRDIFLYRPSEYQPGTHQNGLIVLFDGDKYLEQANFATVMNNLIAAKKIPPTAAILITNPSSQSRSEELPCNPLFAKFLAEELMPWARDQGVYADASRTVVAGASYGGLAATYAGMKHPELFGNVYSQSGSFWWAPDSSPGEPEWLTKQFVNADRLPVKFYLEAGTMEVGRNGTPGILDTTRHLRDVLQAKGYDVRYREFASGHGYLYWRFTFPFGVIDLLSTPNP
ncbi:enterochelin esterase [Blastopirellula marina]|uniref:enterochelin esterase n=1 Tax=Blastopirellula marina TaxID=124 RepID=UPI001304F74D|nr:enterochelin esterase [Blastopirellula marina]